jgi:hypothetical protein
MISEMSSLPNIGLRCLQLPTVLVKYSGSRISADFDSHSTSPFDSIAASQNRAMIIGTPFGLGGVPAVYLSSAILANLANLALCEISKLRAVSEAIDFEFLPLRQIPNQALRHISIIIDICFVPRQ